MESRGDMVAKLTQIRNAADALLVQLGGTVRARRGRPVGSVSVRVPPPPAPRTRALAKRKGGMSAAGRAAVSRAQKARWARLREEAARKGAQVRADVSKSKGAKQG